MTKNHSYVRNDHPQLLVYMHSALSNPRTRLRDHGYDGRGNYLVACDRRFIWRLTGNMIWWSSPLAHSEKHTPLLVRPT